MNQLAIEFHARRADPETSHKAAKRAKEFAGEHHRAILRFLGRSLGDATIYVIAENIGIDHVAVGRRMAELERAGLVRTEGERPGPTGRMCRVWWLA